MVEIDPRTRKQALFVGVGLLVCGLGMYMVHAMSRPAPAQASPALIAPVQLPESKHRRPHSTAAVAVAAPGQSSDSAQGASTEDISDKAAPPLPPRDPDPPANPSATNEPADLILPPPPPPESDDDASTANTAAPPAPGYSPAPRVRAFLPGNRQAVASANGRIAHPPISAPHPVHPPMQRPIARPAPPPRPGGGQQQKTTR